MKIQAFWLIPLSTFFACASPNETSEMRIVGGSKTSNDKTVRGEFPATVGLGFQSGSTNICTGVRVADNAFLTAAHCLPGVAKGSKLYFFASNSKTYDLSILDFKIHPKYNKADGSSMDLASFSLAFDSLQTKADFDQFVTIAPIAYAPVVKGTQVRIAGFGCVKVQIALGDDCAESTNFEYMKVARSVVDDDHSLFDPDNKRYFQLPSPPLGSDAVTGTIAGGDSGGPVYNLNNELIGISKGTKGLGSGETVIQYSIHAWLGHEEARTFISESLSRPPIDNFLVGPGRISYSDSETYVGELAKGVRNGKGVMYYLDGGIYTGGWKDDVRDGEGEMLYADGKRYVGTWKANKREGQGKQTYPAAHPSYKSIEGSWKNDRPHGQAVNVYFDDSRYEGPFFEGVQEGEGRLIRANGDVRTGRWVKGKKEGRFLLVMADGSRFIEEYAADKRISVVPE